MLWEGGGLWFWAAIPTGVRTPSLNTPPSKTDYLTKMVVQGRDSGATPVAAIMTPALRLAVLTPDHSVLEAMELCVKHNVRHVPVMGDTVVGILSIKDIVKVLLDEQQKVIVSLQDYIRGTGY